MARGRLVLAAPLPFWEVFPPEGSTSENGVYVPGRAAFYRVPVKNVAQTGHLHMKTISGITIRSGFSSASLNVLVNTLSTLLIA